MKAVKIPSIIEIFFSTFVGILCLGAAVWLARFAFETWNGLAVMYSSLPLFIGGGLIFYGLRGFSRRRAIARGQFVIFPATIVDIISQPGSCSGQWIARARGMWPNGNDGRFDSEPAGTIKDLHVRVGDTVAIQGHFKSGDYEMIFPAANGQRPASESASAAKPVNRLAVVLTIGVVR